MSAAETIQAAINKLEDDRRVTRDWQYVAAMEALRDGPDVLSYDFELDAGVRIMRWRNTIDAQIAILRGGLSRAKYERDVFPHTYPGLEIDLARAILGEN